METPHHLQHHELTDKIIRAFFDTYNELAGFPEFVVQRAMAITLHDEGLDVESEKPLQVWFRGRRLVTFKADLVVQSSVIVEIKVKPEIDPFNRVQLLHYLKATDLEVGLLLNFGRRPEFSRVIFERQRKRVRFEPPDTAVDASRDIQ
jgi:GxxExxY protein